MQQNTLKVNHPINFISDSEHPIKSGNTKLICAWMTCGGKLMEPNGFSYTVEKTASGDNKMNVVWLIDGAVSVEFEKYEPVQGGLFKKTTEKVTFQEFQLRFRDSDWSNSNNEHPMAFVYFYKENLHKLIGFLKNATPAVKIRTAKGTAVISHNTPEHIKEKILKDL
jgi:hypothetical protein